MGWKSRLEDEYTVKCRACGREIVDPHKKPAQKYVKGECPHCKAIDGKKPVVRAECHSDDHNVEANFDAEPWFKQASKEAVRELADCGWGGDYPADDVAMHMSDSVSRIADMFKYIEIIHGDPSKKDCQGFECHVNSDDALIWLKKHRKDWYEEMAKDEELVARGNFDSDAVKLA